LKPSKLVNSESFAKNTATRDDYQMAIESILRQYEFLAITERMDESLVVMQLLLNLTTHEILYIRA